VATIIGGDNIVDETVLQVLLRKHRTIRSELGISIPVPGSNDEFIETIFDRLFHQSGNRQLNLFAPDVTVVQQSPSLSGSVPRRKRRSPAPVSHNAR